MVRCTCDFGTMYQVLLCESCICVAPCFGLLVTAVFSMSARRVEGPT